MHLVAGRTPTGERVAARSPDGALVALPGVSSVGELLRHSLAGIKALVDAADTAIDAEAWEPRSIVDGRMEVWAAGVTYKRSRTARAEESTIADVYDRVYDAERPELFFKSVPWRVVMGGEPIGVRADSPINVPEPELAVVVNAAAEIVGYTICNDVSSRSIEGENPLYLPQAKVYDGSCALGPGIALADGSTLKNLPVQLTVLRGGRVAFEGETSTSQIRRSLEELVGYLRRELAFPQGVFLMTGTGIVPPNDFSLQRGDLVRIAIGALTLENEVDRHPRVPAP
jgi:2-dehydro-3-deoxy-D-arabinonate dehydratase